MIKLPSLQIVKKFKLDRFERPAIYAMGLGVFLLVILLVQYLTLRVDLSKGGAYSLSPATKHLINELDDVVSISFYANKKLPTRLVPAYREIVDFLNEYKVSANGKVIVRILHPDQDDEAKSESQEANLPEMQFTQIERDQHTNTTSTFGLIIRYGNGQEVVPQLLELNTLEYDVTAAIYKLTKKDELSVGIMGTEVNPDPAQIFQGGPSKSPYATFEKVLGQQYEIDPVFISTESARTEVNKKNKVLMLFDNGSKTYSDAEIQAVKKYLADGGSVVAFADRYWGMSEFSTAVAKHGLFKLFEEYGVKFEDKFVLSQDAELVNVGQQEGFAQILPYFLWIKTNNFNQKTSSYFANINALFFPWVSSISATGSAGIKIEPLVYSTERSWTESGEGLSLQPDLLITSLEQKAASLKFGKHLLAVEANKNNSGKLVVISSGSFLRDEALLRSTNNIEFVLNIVNHLASGGALAGINQRNVGIYPLQVDEDYRELLKYGLTLFGPLSLGIYGLWRLHKRNKLQDKIYA